MLFQYLGRVPSNTNLIQDFKKKIPVVKALCIYVYVPTCAFVNIDNLKAL